MSDADRREERRSRARARAEEHQSGFSTTMFNLPEGLQFWQPELGINTIDIVPYITGNGNPFCKEPGELYYERTFYSYRSIGAEEKGYIAAGKTFGHRDPIQEWRQKAARDPSEDQSYVKSLEPKERQLFLVYDHKHTEKGVQLWEASYHNFGKLLDTQIKNSPISRNWDIFYYPDTTGSTLELTVENESQGSGGRPFKKVKVIYFLPRQAPLPEHIRNHGYCLDSFLKETPYEELWRIFNNLPLDGSHDGEMAPGDSVPRDRGGVASGSTQSRGQTQGSQSGGAANPGYQSSTSLGAGGAGGAASRSAEPEETKEQQKTRVYQLGYLGHSNGLTRAGNPFDKGTERYDWWLEGWMDAVENPQAKEATTAVTAQSLGIAKRDEITFDGKPYTVWKISDDGTLLTLLGDDESVVKDVPVGRVFKGEAVKEKPPFDGDKKPTASTPPASKPEASTPAATSAGGGDKSAWDEEWPA